MDCQHNKRIIRFHPPRSLSRPGGDRISGTTTIGRTITTTGIGTTMTNPGGTTAGSTRSSPAPNRDIFLYAPPPLVEENSKRAAPGKETGRMTKLGSPVEGDIAPDADLMARWSGGTDPYALERLVRRHGVMVLGVCRRLLGDTPDADDAFQAVFLIFVRKGRSLAQPEQLAGWLHGVAVRVARKARAERARRHQREKPMMEPVAPDPRPDTRELRQTLDEELDRLPDKYRLPIVLCEIEGRTLEEAARLLGLPQGTRAGRPSP